MCAPSKRRATSWTRNIASPTRLQCVCSAGHKFSDYREEDLGDPICEEERLRLNNRAAVVTVVATDGRQLAKRVQYSKGHPKHPLGNDELNAKFMDAVVPLLGQARADQIAER